jgi:hypothetical protein
LETRKRLNTRELRIRRLVHRLNRRRKEQAAQIDILCGSLIESQRKFLAQLGQMNILLGYYETILAAATAETVLDSTVQYIARNTPGTAAAIYLQNSFTARAVNAEAAQFPCEDIEASFTQDVCEAICGSARSVDVQEMLEAGLQMSPKLLKTLAIAAIPFGRAAGPRGFILLYRQALRQFSDDELKTVCWLTVPLAAALEQCTVHAAD